MPKNTFSNCDLSIAYQFSFWLNNIHSMRNTTKQPRISLLNYFMKMIQKTITFKATIIYLNIHWFLIVCFLWLIVDYALFRHFKTRWAFMRSTCIMKMIRILYVYSHNLSNIKSFTYYEWYWCCWNKYNAMLIYKWDQNFKCN